MNKKYLKVSELRLLQLITLTALQELKRLTKLLDINFYAIAGTLLGSYRHDGFIPWDSDLDVAMMRDDYEIFVKKADELIDEKFIVQSDYSHKNNRTCFARIRVKNTVINEKRNKILHDTSGFYIDIFPIDKIKRKPNLIDITFHKFIKILIRIKAYRNGKIYSSTKLRSLLGKLLNTIFIFVPYKNIHNFLNSYMRRHQHINTNLVTNYNSKYGIKKQTMDKTIYGIPQKHNFEGIEIPTPSLSQEWLGRIYGDYMRMPIIPDLDLASLMPSYDIDFGLYKNLLKCSEYEIRKSLDLPLFPSKH